MRQIEKMTKKVGEGFAKDLLRQGQGSVVRCMLKR